MIVRFRYTFINKKFYISRFQSFRSVLLSAGDDISPPTCHPGSPLSQHVCCTSSIYSSVKVPSSKCWNNQCCLLRFSGVGGGGGLGPLQTPRVGIKLAPPGVQFYHYTIQLCFFYDTVNTFQVVSTKQFCLKDTKHLIPFLTHGYLHFCYSCRLLYLLPFFSLHNSPFNLGFQSSVLSGFLSCVFLLGSAFSHNTFILLICGFLLFTNLVNVVPFKMSIS